MTAICYLMLFLTYATEPSQPSLYKRGLNIYTMVRRRRRITFAIYTVLQIIIIFALNLNDVVRSFSTITTTTPHQQSTRLYEQPANIRNLLGPISPSTLQQYNLPPSELTDGWSAQIITKQASKLMSKSSEIGNQEILGKQTIDVQLVPKNDIEHYVDTFKVNINIPNLDDTPVGLGIELLEVQGGRDDGLGITIITGLVNGGNIDLSMKQSKQVGEDVEQLMYGDSISKAELVIKRQSIEDVTSIQTECLGYDSTVEALVDMLSTLNSNSNNRDIQESSVILTINRLRRRPIIKCQVQYPPWEDKSTEIINLQPGENLRLAMLQRNIALNDPLAQRYDGKSTGSGNCGGSAMCRTCAVSVIRGKELLSEPKVNEKKIIQETKNVSRMRLSCKTFVGRGMKEGELVIQINPRQW